ncbi:MAG: YfhO family protein [Elusimicrobiota bacterium]|jgi:uncharacterized membrane protein YfhO|nr:YfhO family protein [Elusimicrobiota bacterium]
MLSNKKNYYLVYTLCFQILFIAMFWKFIFSGYSFISTEDPEAQHYIALVYWGQYLRSLFFSFMSGNFSIPLWDFNIGYGADILSALHYYIIGDPLALLSFFVPLKYSQFLFSLLIFLRLYLAGLAFSLYSFKMKAQGFPVLLGSLIYISCSFILYSVFTQPFFLNPLIYLPLLFIGAENIFEGKSPIFFITMVFISLASNFYFFYMLSIFIFVYFFIRQARRSGECPAFLYFFKFTGYYLTGFLCACFIFIPNLFSLMSAVRKQAQFSLDWLYPLKFYPEFLYSFITVIAPSNWTALGYCAVSLIVIAALFIKRGVQIKIKALFIIFLCLLAFPPAGQFFNGFSYVSNRWVFAFSFFVSFITVLNLQKIISLGAREIKIISALCALYLLCAVIFADFRAAQIIIPGIILLCFSLFAFLCSAKKISVEKTYMVFILLLFINAGVNSFFVYDEDYVSKKLKYWGQPTDMILKSPIKEIKNDEKSAFSRYEKQDFEEDRYPNIAAALHIKGISFYFSLANPYIFKFLSEMDYFETTDYLYLGLDERTMLDSLFNVGHFITERRNSIYAPFGFEASKSYEKFNGGLRVLYNIYENKKFIPFGYVYKKFINRQEYEKLTSLQKQQALMQAAALDIKDEAFDKSFAPLEVKGADLDFVERGIDYQMKNQPHLIKFEGNSISVSTPNAFASLFFKGLKNSETYIRFQNLSYKNENEKNTKIQIVITSSESAKAKVLKVIDFITPDYFWYVGKNDYMVNAGYSADFKEEIVLRFEKDGVFKYDKIEIISLPMENYEKQATALRQTTLQNVKVSANEINAEISLKENGILCLSIPYSKGWKAWVDGKEQDLIRVNTAMTGLLLKKGFFKITLKYTSPGLKIGIALSCFGFAIFAFLFFISKRRKMRFF